MFRKQLDEGIAGDNVGVLLRGIQRDEIERGQVLACLLYTSTVTSASPLSEEQKTRLLTIVSQKFEIKTRRLVEKIDEELIGGFVIKAKNKFVDTSIRSQLQAFKMNLK